MVGGEGEGWGVAITTLMHERATLAFGLQVERADRAARADRARAQESRGENGGVATEDPVIRQRLAQLLIESEVLRLNAYRGLSAIMRSGVPGPEGSLGKWHWSEVNQSLTELAMDIAGRGRCCADDALDLPASCARGPTRSRAARPRSSRTSSPSGCSASPKR